MQSSMLPSELVRTVSLLLEDLGTPISLGVALRLRYGEWDGISEMALDPRNYLETQASKFAADSAAVGLLKKLQELPCSHDKTANAVAKWWQGEQACKRTNFRLDPYLRRSLFPEERNDRIASFLTKVRSVVKELIGYRPSDSPEGRFGPGATFSDRGRYTTVPDKMTSNPSLTRNALWCLVEWRDTAWARAFLHGHCREIDLVPGNRFATVPKTAKTDRAIASEPSLNVFYQLALGRQLRGRLKKSHGWDLDRAQDIHRQIAEVSSVTREFATLDLSNASDTVARSLVELLLPRPWFVVLDSLRSKRTQSKKLTPQGSDAATGWVMLEKFSSMGNGFTFELETVLFASLAIAVCREAGYAGVLGHDVFVFGDDIIVPSPVTRALKSVLEFCGFSLNEEKSFFDGTPFRESCGGDYFAGKSVRPYFLKDLPNGPQDYLAFANGLRALFDRLDHTGRACRRRAWFSVLDCLPSRIRLARGPQALGDIVIHDEERFWTSRWRGSIRYLKCLKPGRKRLVNAHAFDAEVTLACALYGVGSVHPKGWAWHPQGGVIPRNGVLDYRLGWVPYS